MKVNGTLINYYFHCKRQCYLHGNRLNLEDNSELVRIGKAVHEEKSEKYTNSEITIDNIKIDRITKEYVTEIKKSDADPEAGKWQLLFYLKVLKEKGIERKGRLQFVEKNKKDSKVIEYVLTQENEKELEKIQEEIIKLINEDNVPKRLNEQKCKKCSYYEYCYV